MNQDDLQELRSFESDIRQLMKVLSQTRTELADVRTQLSRKETEIEELQSELRISRKEYTNLKTARMIEISDTDLKASKQKITRLVREVNKCIRLLSSDTEEILTTEKPSQTADTQTATAISTKPVEEDKTKQEKSKTPVLEKAEKAETPKQEKAEVTEAVNTEANETEVIVNPEAGKTEIVKEEQEEKAVQETAENFLAIVKSGTNENIEKYASPEVAEGEFVKTFDSEYLKENFKEGFVTSEVDVYFVPLPSSFVFHSLNLYPSLIN